MRQRRRVLRQLVSLSPFAASLAVYDFVRNQLKEQWFASPYLYYLFAGVCALAVGLGLRLAGQLYLAGREPGSGSAELEPAAPAAALDGPTVGAVLRATASAIAADYREVDLAGSTVCGWSQYLSDRVPPSAIGTSYGLRLVIALDIRDPVINRRRIVDSLIALQRPGGGWAASTQRGIGRPEVTAWVLDAAVRQGITAAEQQHFISLLEDMAGADDPVARSRTTIVALLVATLADIAPRSAVLAELATLLADAAGPDPRDRSASWGESLRGLQKESVPHTALAVTALHKASRARPGDPGLAAAVVAGTKWLARDTTALEQTDEQIRRPVAGGGEVDALFVGHFTAALVARALMADEAPTAHRGQLRRAVRAVVESQENGVWVWHDGSKPIWMTYQGTTVLRDYAMLNPEWPP